MLVLYASAKQNLGTNWKKLLLLSIGNQKQNSEMLSTT
jgi:hypothetical protein